MKGRLHEALTIRAALVLGFGLTLGLWFFAGYQFTQRLTDLQKSAATINERYIRAQRRLSTVRAQVLLGSVIVRDALLDPGSESTDSYRQRLVATFTLSDEALRRYDPDAASTPDEQERLRQLRVALDSFQSTMLEVMASESSHWPTQARELLQSRIMPRQDVMVRISDEAQDLNRNGFIEQRDAISELYGATERRLWRQLGLALLASLTIAVLASLWAGRLERRLRVERDHNVQNAGDLKRLSAEIVRVQEEERRSMARELHDEVGQLLTAIKVDLASAQRAIDTAGGSPMLLDNVRTIADGAIHAVRDLSHLLHPALLDDLGLPAATDRYLQEFGKRHGLKVELLDAGTGERYSAETESAVYRVIQEALTNVAKHAGATACRVRFQRQPSMFLITVEDNGAGFVPDPDGSRTGLGLIGIRERVSQLQGSVRLESAPGHGTRLVVELPAPLWPQAEAEVDAGALQPAAVGPSLV